MMPIGRTAAILEVLGVYVAGQFVVSLLIRLLRLHLNNPLASFTVGITDAELLTASRQLFLLLMLQYAGWFVLIVPINWWHRRRGPSAYGLTRAGRSWTALLLAGLATAALAEWPVVSVSLANDFYKLGETVPWRQAFFDTSWRRWQFWLFSAVLSWAVVAGLEELFYRGYCQRRLAEEWGDGAAVIGTSCLFVFSHTQYLIPNAYNVGMIIGLLVSAVGFGVVFAWTRSVIPSILAHAIINVPMTPLWQGMLLTVFVIVAIVTAQRAADVVRKIFSGAKVIGCVALAVVGLGYALLARRVPNAEFAALVMVVVAVGLEAIERRRPRTAAQSSSLT
jgi:membrane protease YdiL (CAAX protease family)